MTHQYIEIKIKELEERIKAIEKEPCEDAISRQAVKDKYKERFVNNLKDNDRRIDLSKYAEKPYKAFCEFMDSIPPITPLPKGHGRLIDADELKTAFPCGESVRTECVRATIDYAPTIIEADKAESEG